MPRGTKHKTRVYKNVSKQKKKLEAALSLKEMVQNWLQAQLEDPITKILMKGSNLTVIQLETLLIDVLAENVAQKHIKYDEKATFRRRSVKITRGAFNRTLSQAKNNIRSSMYTILLLGYLGVLNHDSLIHYQEVSSALQSYIKGVKQLAESSNEVDGLDKQAQIVNLLREELEKLLK
ncbi:MAG: hypothetical protein JSV35_05825 [Candidatus Bathyarchaeota archaeon]|nr:MAG: hypothetical protein JSV35_05825 [Candidatus Bathyarchaeota archaeon]